MMQGSESENVQVSEYFRKRDETALDRMRRQTRAALSRFWDVLKHALVLAPLMVAALLMLDLPLRLFDGFTGGQDAWSPSNWLSWGDALMALSMAFLMGVARCRGARQAGRVASLSWLIAVAAILALLFYLAPQLGPGDLPSAQFGIGFFVSWFGGQLVGVHIYDVTRGGKWWRAPFYGLVFGFLVQSVLYFVIIYSFGSHVANVPWIGWTIIDLCLKFAFALAFLPVYRSLRRTLRPHLGLGGY